MDLELISRSPASPARPTPLLFIHGAWHGAWCWEEHFLDWFAEHGYAAYALSLRAHGKSEGRQGLRWARVAGYVEDVAQVAAQLPSPPVVIGHSMGGFVVLKYLEKHTALAGVLLASVPHYGALPALLRIGRQHPIQAMKIFLMLSPKQLIATPALTRQAFFSSNMPDEQLNHYFSLMQEESFLGFLDMAALALPKPSRVKAPLLVMGAAGDQNFLPHEVQATARAYGTEAVIVPDIAHDVMLEARWQAVASHILNWLRTQGL